MSRRVLVAGIGNVFSTDDGFGVEVVDRLASGPWPPGVRVADFGIRGVHLAYELLEGYDGLILVDAVPMGEAPGTVAVIEPDASPGGRSVGVAPGAPADTALVMDAHSMSPEIVLGTLSSLGGKVGRTLVLGCQPASLEDGMGLTPAVAAAVDGAADLCRQLVGELVTPAGKEMSR
jgi:hydrogenase maturation protease